MSINNVKSNKLNSCMFRFWHSHRETNSWGCGAGAEDGQMKLEKRIKIRNSKNYGRQSQFISMALRCSPRFHPFFVITFSIWENSVRNSN